MTARAMARSANDRFKRRSSRTTGVGLLLAVGLHLAVFALVSFEAEELDASEVESLRLVLPPETALPPPPEEIARPAAPRIGDVDPLDATIPPTDWDDLEPRALPPPRPPTRDADRARFIPYDTAPVLRNGEEIARLLRRAQLREAREGRVELWLYVTAEGWVERSQVKTSSGVPELDGAALEVAGRMLFSPAMNRDRPTAVWVSQWVTFIAR